MTNLELSESLKDDRSRMTKKSLPSPSPCYLSKEDEDDLAKNFYSAIQILRGERASAVVVGTKKEGHDEDVLVVIVVGESAAREILRAAEKIMDRWDNKGA